jgi:CubicO group peptidase (beta-lactamase class C family)
VSLLEVREPPRFESGGGGLAGTIDDYYAFCRMMLDGDERVLSRVSAELMTCDQVTPAQREGMDVFFGTHSSWGFGCAVDIARNEIYHTPGRFGWTGGFGTTAYTDPVEGLVAILFTQQMMESPEPPKVFVDFFTLAYAAME